MSARQKQQRPAANRAVAWKRIPNNWRERLPVPADYYAQNVTKLTKPNSGGWAQARCPFHDDATASLSVQVTPGTRGGFRCFACGVKGDLLAFHRKRTGLGFMDAVRALVGGRR